MAVNITEADAYIGLNVIDIEDWNDSDDAKKQRLLNVAERVLTNRFSNYTIPDNAVYEYGAALAIAFNDTNRLNNHGIASFALEGMSFNFKDTLRRDLQAFMPDASLQLIGEANGVKLSGRRVGKAVL